ncbi:MAG: DUF3142 domain-containing protein [Lentisphaerae bacterium]|nr:DUF3142 domain-containing protein [Lentisphaerota bacterium]
MIKTVLLILLLPIASKAVDFYIWQRQLNNQLIRDTVLKWQRETPGTTYCLAGELENDGRQMTVSPEQFLEPAWTTPVIRIHIRNMTRKTEELAKTVIKLHTPWAACRSLQIDLDCPEFKLSYYTSLMQQLRKQLPDYRLSATVLPCHLRHHKEFKSLADACDYFVVQVHALEKDGNDFFIIDRNTALEAIKNAGTFDRPFKIALPFYTHTINGKTIKPDLHIFPELIRHAEKFPKMSGIIAFRLGLPGERDTVSINTVMSACKGEYTPGIIPDWQKHPDGAWHLFLKNRGHFVEKVTLELKWNKNFKILDFDTFNHAAADRRLHTLTLTLPPDGMSVPYLWLRCPNDIDLNKYDPLTVTIKEIAKK